MAVFFASLGLVFVAEMGDKTQFAAMALAAKYSAWKVVTGIFIAVAVLNLLAVMVGTYVTCAIPLYIIRIAASFVFLLFGIMNLKDEDENEKERNFKFGAVAATALTFFIGELGDKTQIMTITLAAKYGNPYIVFAGSSAGMLLADSLGIIVGAALFRKIPKKAIKIISSAIFIIFGILGLIESVPNKFITSLNVIIFVAVIAASMWSIHRYNSKNKNRISEENEEDWRRPEENHTL